MAKSRHVQSNGSASPLLLPQQRGVDVHHVSTDNVLQFCPEQLSYPRPFVKWAGGKRQVLSQYAPFFPKNIHTYFEPFLGGGAIFFHLQPSKAVLTDINAELVNVYQHVRDSVEEVLAILREHQKHHSKEYYYSVRANLEVSPLERAARFLYLNKTCFNGLYRENSKGHFNVPMGRYKKPAIYNPELLCSASRALQSTAIALESFENILNYSLHPHDLVYFDPPYHPISATSRFTSYNRYAFCADDQIRLKETFAELARRGIQVMLSNSDCFFIRELYEGFNIHTIQAARSINSKSERRGKITELLITSY